MAEAKALFDGLAFLERIGCRSCQVEADALEVIQACNRDVDINSPYSAILADCFQKASEMEEIAFPHCHREANQVAHELAKLAYSSRENKVWEGDPPAYIQPFVINDVNLFTTL
jgi:ATP phosphoribosyltransferase regulatory subunit HisZ